MEINKAELIKVLNMNEDKQKAAIQELLATDKDKKHTYYLWEGTCGDFPMVECSKCKQKKLREGVYNVVPYEEPLRYGICSTVDPLEESLANLAFQLRGKVDFNFYLETLEIVYHLWQKRGTVDEQMENNLVTFTCWLAVYITAIDMIIAVLIVKG